MTDANELRALLQGIRLCPVCEGEGHIADGLDEAACSMDCPPCFGTGYAIDSALIASREAAVKPETPDAASKLAKAMFGIDLVPAVKPKPQTEGPSAPLCPLSNSADNSELEPDDRQNQRSDDADRQGGEGREVGGRIAVLPSGLQRGERDVRREGGDSLSGGVGVCDTPTTEAVKSLLAARLRAYRPTNEWGDGVRHAICDEAADALESLIRTLRYYAEPENAHTVYPDVPYPTGKTGERARAAIATEAGTAETTKIGSVHEGAAIAQTPGKDA